MQPRAIVFDVMDTLVVDPFHHEMPSFLGMTLPELLAAKHPTAWVDFELGRMDEESFLACFLPGREWDAEGFCAHVRASYRWIPGMRELLVELRGPADRPLLAALSNYPRWYRWIDERCGLSSLLDAAVLSYEIGARKPDPESYLRACARLGVRPDQVLFVDDRPSNCGAAEALGMDAIVFQGSDRLRAELAARGLAVGD